MAQPEGSSLCGQIAVAVIANIDLTKSIELFGKKSSTRTKQVARVLRLLGFECPDRLKRKYEATDKFGIAKLSYKGNRNSGHWVVIDNHKIYDGVWGNADGTVTWPVGARLTSYLPVTRKNLCSTERDNSSITAVGG